MATINKTGYLLFLIALAVCKPAIADGKIKIARVEDANRFVTADSLTISLCNVRCFSIADADSFKRAFAVMVVRDAEKILGDRELLAEVASRADSLILVHLWEERKVFGKRSLNELWLANGWGWYEEEPSGRYAKFYRRAAGQAEKGNRGIHDQTLFRKPRPAIAGMWLSLGLGRGEYKDKSPDWDDHLMLDLGLHLRKKKLVLSGGIQGIYLSEASSAGGSYLLAGRSFYGEGAEMVVSMGGSINQWSYNTESSRGIIRSSSYPGLQAKVQMIGHFPQALGFALDLDANLNKEKSYYAFSLHLILGGWKYAR